MDWSDILWAPVIAPIAIIVGISRMRVASAERPTQRYLQNLDSASCLSDLGQALSPLLDGVDHVDQVFAKFATLRAVYASGTKATLPDTSMPN